MESDDLSVFQVIFALFLVTEDTFISEIIGAIVSVCVFLGAPVVAGV